MKNLKLFLWIFLLWLIQTIFPEYIRINGLLPQLLYVFTICIAFNENDIRYYVLVSVITGLFAELTFGISSGFNFSIYVMTSFLVVLIGEVFYKDMFLFVALVTVVLSLFSNSIYFLLKRDLFFDMTYKNALMSVILPTSLYNAIISVIIDKLLKITIYKKRR